MCGLDEGKEAVSKEKTKGSNCVLRTYVHCLQNDWPEAAVMGQVMSGQRMDGGDVTITEKSGLICSLETGPRHRHKKERVEDKAQK